jgi:hypothetical protein
MGGRSCLNLPHAARQPGREVTEVKIDQDRIDRGSWDEIQIDGWFKALVPPTWEVEDDDNEVVIFDPSGFGELSIALLLISGGETKKQRASEIISAWADELKWQAGHDIAIFKRTRDVLTVSAETIADEPEGEIVYWRVFAVIGRRIALDIGYCCPVEDRDREDAVIEGIVDSIRLTEPEGRSRARRRYRETAGE